MQLGHVGARVSLPVLKNGSVTHCCLLYPLVTGAGQGWSTSSFPVQGQVGVSTPMVPQPDSQGAPEHPSASFAEGKDSSGTYISGAGMRSEGK